MSNGPTRIDKRWWRESTEEVFRAVNSVVDTLQSQQVWRQTLNDRHARLYGDMTVIGLSGRGAAVAMLDTQRPRLSLNVVKNCCNAVTSKITKSKPKPMFLTSGGDWSQKRKAEGLSKAVEGAFYQGGLYKLAPRIFRDSTVFDAGINRVCDDRDYVYYERILPHELAIDEAEAVYGEPRSYYLTRHVDRSVLRELYPDFARQIDDAPRADTPAWLPDVGADLVRVREAWHLPSGPEATDGRHVVVIDTATLVDEEFEDDSPPFVFLRWNERLTGFWGCSLAEELTTLQLEINRTLQKIGRILDLCATPKVLLEAGSKVKQSHITNEIGAIIVYEGATPPQFITHNSVPPELRQHLEMLYARAYEITGISQLSAQSQKPAGLNSGVALQTYSDIETERFLVTARQYEEFFLETARQTIKAIRRIAKRNNGYRVKYAGKGVLQQIDWNEVDLDDDAYVMQAYPVNALASSPAARLSQVQEMMAGGIIGTDEARKLLDYPDLERANSLARAASDDIEMLIEIMIEEGIYQVPEPFMDLGLAIKMTQSAYLMARVDGVPEDRLDLLRQFMADCKALLDAANPPPQAPMPEGIPPMGPEGMDPALEQLPPPEMVA